MGGYGSGQHGGRPTVESSLQIDLAWMLREGYAREGARLYGTLNWHCGGQPSGWISYAAAMDEVRKERLLLAYTSTFQGERVERRQAVRLTHTVPNYGGKRWWMLCPVSGHRVAKLYMPPGGDVFASRKAWRLGYQCQRDAARDRPFERLFKLQKRLGCAQGWEQPIFKPKGMWGRTWQRYLAEYWRLDEQCGVEMAKMIARHSL